METLRTQASLLSANGKETHMTKYRRIEKIDGQDQMVTVTRDEITRLVGEESVDQCILEEGWIEFSDQTFNLYQEATRQTAIYPKDQALAYLSLGVASEAGEIAGKMKKWIRDGDAKMSKEEFTQALSYEIGDVLWYCARLADELGLSLSQISENNMGKLLDRKERGALKGSGDDR